MARERRDRYREKVATEPSLIAEKKKCSKCGEVKGSDDFYRNNSSSDGLTQYCKACTSKYYWERRNSRLATDPHYRLKIELGMEIREKLGEYIWHLKFGRKLRRHQRASKPRSMRQEKWEIRHFNPKYNKYAFSKKYHLPYTAVELAEHLEAQFKPGMNWENFSSWHIDHIKPDSLFKYKSPKNKQFQASWSLGNLQPLWAEENLRKGAKWEGD
jgi:hypothetical protein